MSDVTRYWVSDGNPVGGLVRYSDYAVLAERLKACEAELKDAYVAAEGWHVHHLEAVKLRADLARVTADKEWFEEFACSCNVPDYICQAHSERDETNSSLFKDRMAAIADERDDLKKRLKAREAERDKWSQHYDLSEHDAVDYQKAMMCLQQERDQLTADLAATKKALQMAKLDLLVVDVLTADLARVTAERDDAITALESGFMQGAYSRLLNLQHAERERDDLRADLARVTAELDESDVLAHEWITNAELAYKALAATEAERDRLKAALDKYAKALDDIYDDGGVGRLLVAKYFGVLHDQAARKHPVTPKRT